MESFLVGNEVDFKRSEFFQRQRQLLHGAGESVETENHHHLKCAATGIGHQGDLAGARTMLAETLALYESVCIPGTAHRASERTAAL